MSKVSALEVRELTEMPDVVACFEAVRTAPYAWLLDSGGSPGAPTPELARYSFMGSDPYLVLRSRGNTNEIECRRGVVPGFEVGVELRGIDGTDFRVTRHFRVTYHFRGGYFRVTRNFRVTRTFRVTSVRDHNNR